MTIHVHHVDDDAVEVTLIPGRLARLFGAKLRRGVALRDECDGLECGARGSSCRRLHWWWKATELPVGDAIEREIECTTIYELAEARLIEGGA